MCPHVCCRRGVKYSITLVYIYNGIYVTFLGMTDELIAPVIQNMSFLRLELLALEKLFLRQTISLDIVNEKTLFMAA